MWSRSPISIGPRRQYTHPGIHTHSESHGQIQPADPTSVQKLSDVLSISQVLSMFFSLLPHATKEETKLLYGTALADGCWQNWLSPDQNKTPVSDTFLPKYSIW